MTALLDTSVLLAALTENDLQHARCAAALEQEDDLILPDVVLPELTYLLIRDAGYQPVIRFLEALGQGEMPLAAPTAADLTRAADILEKYADSRVDFVDSVIVAMAERLNVTRILTLDHRHFSLFRPKHCPNFELVP